MTAIGKSSAAQQLACRTCEAFLRQQWPKPHKSGLSASLSLRRGAANGRIWQTPRRQLQALGRRNLMGIEIAACGEGNVVIGLEGGSYLNENKINGLVVEKVGSRFRSLRHLHIANSG